MSVGRIALVSQHVFKESVRDRVLYAIAAFAVILVAASLLIGQVTAGQDLKIIKDLGLATIELAGIVMAVFIGIGLVAREIDRRSIFNVLAKPVARWEFIVGKFLGLTMTIFVNVILMTVAFYLVLGVIGWMSPEHLRKSWEAPALDPALLKAVLMIAAELTVLTAVALFFSTFSSSAILSLVLTVGIWVAGVESEDLRRFGDFVVSPLSPLVSAIGWLVPAFSAFDVKAAVVHGQAVPATLIAWRLLYAAVYSAVMVGAATVVFARREFR
jgi:Cu-processing system permease protein